MRRSIDEDEASNNDEFSGRNPAFVSGNEISGSGNEISGSGKPLTYKKPVTLQNKTSSEANDLKTDVTETTSVNIISDRVSTEKQKNSNSFTSDIYENDKSFLTKIDSRTTKKNSITNVTVSNSTSLNDAVLPYFQKSTNSYSAFTNTPLSETTDWKEQNESHYFSTFLSNTRPALTTDLISKTTSQSVLVTFPTTGEYLCMRCLFVHKFFTLLHVFVLIYYYCMGRI